MKTSSVVESVHSSRLFRTGGDVFWAIAASGLGITILAGIVLPLIVSTKLELRSRQVRRTANTVRRASAKCSFSAA